MPQAFSNALYYPTIDINDSDWLKTALLFWDSISTIVPESMEEPYRHRDTKYLSEIGFLRPFRVNSNDESVIGIEEDIISLMCSTEFRHSLVNMPKDNSKSGIWASKMSEGVKEKIDKLLDRHFNDEQMFDIIRNELSHYKNSILFGDKLSYRIRDIIDAYHNPQRISERLSGWIRNDFETRWTKQNDIYYLDERFTNIYMLVLAEKISENHSLALVTDSVFYSNTGNNLRLSNQAPNMPDYYGYPGHLRAPHLEQGLLLDYIIKGLSISPDTDLEDIVSFKEKHRDELGRFKTELANLTKGIEAGQPLDALREEINNKYNNEFSPAFRDFKKTLDDSGIKWLTDTFLKASFVTTSATGIPMALLGMPVPEALCAGVGISVIASAVSYNIQKKKALRENPYSYLLSIQNYW